MAEGASRVADDWATSAVDTVDHVVGLVRDRAVEPVRTAARIVVFGLLIAIVASMTAALLTIALVRVLASYVPPDDAVWPAYAILGGIFSLAGGFLFAKRG